MTDFTTVKKSVNGKAESTNSRLPDQVKKRWWELKGRECSDSIQSIVNVLQKAQTARMRQNAVSMRLYGNFAMFGQVGAAYARATMNQAATRDRQTYNAIQSIIDTVHSKIGENKPRPYFLTSGGTYKQQRKAKKLNQFEEGNFYENRTYDIGGMAFRDGEIWGDGFIHVFARGGKIRHERVISSELWVDEEEAQYGFPRSMHRVKDVDRDELAANFSKQRDAIWKATKATDVYTTASGTVSDMVKVVESWHLGAMNEDGELEGGKHCMALVSDSTMLLEPEDWVHPFFPFARVSWCPKPTGYWSQGLAEQLQGDQIELNKEMLHIQRSLHIAGSVKVFVKVGSKIVKETINNEIGGIINYTGDKPEYYTPPPIHPMYMEHTQSIIDRMYLRAGVSELSAGGKKPQGLNSGAAQREFEDIQSDRFRTIQRYNDNLYLELAKMDVAIAREMDKTTSVRVPGRMGFSEMNFRKDIGDIRDSEFVLQCFPVSRLPKDPSGRLQTITEYIQAGFITQRQGRRALDFPDIDSIESLANAQEDILTKVLDDIIDEGKYAPPEPTDDLKAAKEMVLEYIQRYRLLELEDDKLSQLRNWNVQVDALIKRTLPPPMAMPAGGTPQARPEQLPTNPMVPNTPRPQPAV